MIKEIQQIQDEQGWTNNTLLKFVLQYVECNPKHLQNGLVDYLADIALDENEFKPDWTV